MRSNILITVHFTTIDWASPLLVPVSTAQHRNTPIPNHPQETPSAVPDHHPYRQELTRGLKEGLHAIPNSPRSSKIYPEPPTWTP